MFSAATRLPREPKPTRSKEDNPEHRRRASLRGLNRALLGVRKLGAIGPENTRVRTVLSRNVTDRTYVFCVVRRDSETADNYRHARRAMLLARVEITKLRRQSLRVIVGVGVAPGNDPDQSVDLVVREFPGPWPREAREAAEHLCDQLGVPREMAGLETHFHDDEFPAPSDLPTDAPRPRAKTLKAAVKAKRKAQRAARKRNRR